MYIPIRKSMGMGQLFAACTVGVFISLYAWSPIIKEQIEKEKLDKEVKL